MPAVQRSRVRVRVFALASFVALVGSTIGSGVPVVRGSGETIALDVSWTRPGVAEVLSPPTALRVGDVVTVAATSDGFANPRCQYVFSQAGMTGGESYMRVDFDPAPTNVCPAWTFVVPPSPPGDYRIQADAWESVSATKTIPLTLEAGGEPAPFVSNYPVMSWAASDVIASEPLAFGNPFTVDLPAGLTDCEVDFGGSIWTGLKAFDDDCSDWIVSIPELRPDATSSGSFALPMRSHILVVGHGAGGGRGVDVSTWTAELAVGGSDSDTFASSMPAAVFATSTKPHFVARGSVPLTPTLVGIDSGTCTFYVGIPNRSPAVPAGTVPVVDGQCAPVSFDAEAIGRYHVDVTVADAGMTVSQAWGWFDVTDPIPAPTIAVPANLGSPGDDVQIDVSVPNGTPTDFDVSVTPAASCTGASGQLDVMNEIRTATVTCQFPDPGTYTIDASMTDVLGTTTQSSKQVTVAGPPDTNAPAVSAVSNTFPRGARVTDGKVPVRFAWIGTDAGSGVATFDVDLKTDAGPFVSIGSALTAANLSRALAPGHAYRIRVRATDHSDNIGDWTLGQTFTIGRFQESSSAIHWHGTWWSAANASYWGGHDRYARQAGATASLTFTGRSFAWVGSVGPSRGRARIYIDGKLVASLDLHAATAQARRLLFTTAWSTSVRRTVTIRISGTAGHPRGDVDALVTGS